MPNINGKAQQERTYDAIVVGSGMSGGWAAKELTEKGLKVLLLERDCKPVSATVRNFGQVVPSGMSSDLQSTAIRSLEIYSDLQRTVDISARQNGTWYIASDDLETEIIHEMAGRNKATGYESYLKSKSAVLETNPSLKESYVREALFYPREFSVDPTQLVYRIIDFLTKEYDVDYRPNTKIISMEVRGSEVWSRDSMGDNWVSSKAVVCNGHDFKSLFPKRFLNADIEVAKLQMMRTLPVEGVALCGNILTGRSIRRYESFQECKSWKAKENPDILDDFGVHILFKQEMDGSVIVGDSHEYADAANAEELTYKMNQHLNELMIQAAQDIINFPHWKMAEYWAGYYSQMKNSKHYYQDDIDDRIHFLTAIGGKGMTLGPHGSLFENLRARIVRIKYFSHLASTKALEADSSRRTQHNFQQHQT